MDWRAALLLEFCRPRQERFPFKSAAPPASLALLPYGSTFSSRSWPFFPTVIGRNAGAYPRRGHCPVEDSVEVPCPVMAAGDTVSYSLGHYSEVFWPMNHELYLAASGSIRKSEAEVMQMARRWVTLDWLRVTMIAAGFVSSVRAISLPIVVKKHFVVFSSLRFLQPL